MVKRDPDDIISALSKNLKANDSPVLKLTFKRGGLWLKEHAKAHSRIAKRAFKIHIKQQSLIQEDKEWPLLVRYRENHKDKQESVRRNSICKIGKGLNFIESLLGVFRVNFFKQKNQNQEKIASLPTKPNAESKTSKKKIAKNLRNSERRKKRLEIKRVSKKQKLMAKQKK